MDMPKNVERRKYRRIETDQVISFAPLESRDVLAVGRDVSAGGGASSR